MVSWDQELRIRSQKHTKQTFRKSIPAIVLLTSRQFYLWLILDISLSLWMIIQCSKNVVSDLASFLNHCVEVNDDATWFTTVYNIITCFEPSGCIERKEKIWAEARSLPSSSPFLAFLSSLLSMYVKRDWPKRSKGFLFFSLSKELHFRCNEFF